MKLFGTMFDTCLIPGVEEDRVASFDSSGHVIVICRGHIFKIDIGDGTDTPRDLVQVFSGLLDDYPLEQSGIGILTADSRTQWAKVSLILILHSSLLTSDSSAVTYS